MGLQVIGVSYCMNKMGEKLCGVFWSLVIIGSVAEATSSAEDGSPYSGKTVHVINSCHLDIGFKDTAASIVNLYFDQHIPNVVALGRKIRNGTFTKNFTDSKLNFMFQSWIIYEIHDWFMIGFGIFMIGQTWIFPEGGTRKCDQLWGTVADGPCQAARSKEHRYAKKNLLDSSFVLWSTSWKKW